MRISEPGAVYDARDKIIGYRCSECGKVVQAMWGDTCNECREKERRHKELLHAIQERKP